MSSDNQETYDKLIAEIKQNREEMSEMLDTAVSFRRQVNQIIPPTTDFKKRYLIDEKMKLVVSIFGVELDIRKQRDASLKSELELRRKVTGEENVKPDESIWKDSAMLAKALETLEGKRHPEYKDEVPMDITERQTERVL